jgi:hypothetical protein
MSTTDIQRSFNSPAEKAKAISDYKKKLERRIKNKSLVKSAITGAPPTFQDQLIENQNKKTQAELLKDNSYQRSVLYKRLSSYFNETDAGDVMRQLTNDDVIVINKYWSNYLKEFEDVSNTLPDDFVRNIKMFVDKKLAAEPPQPIVIPPPAQDEKEAMVEAENAAADAVKKMINDAAKKGEIGRILNSIPEEDDEKADAIKRSQQLDRMLEGLVDRVKKDEIKEPILQREKGKTIQNFDELRRKLGKRNDKTTKNAIDKLEKDIEIKKRELSLKETPFQGEILGKSNKIKEKSMKGIEELEKGLKEKDRANLLMMAPSLRGRMKEEDTPEEDLKEDIPEENIFKKAGKGTNFQARKRIELGVLEALGNAIDEAKDFNRYIEQVKNLTGSQYNNMVGWKISKLVTGDRKLVDYKPEINDAISKGIKGNDKIAEYVIKKAVKLILKENSSKDILKPFSLSFGGSGIITNNGHLSARFIPMGTKLIDLNGLKRGYLKVAYPSKMYVPLFKNTPISHDFSQLIHNFILKDKFDVKDYKKLVNDERRKFDELLNITKLSPHETMALLGFKKDTDTKREKVLKKIQVIQGEIMSGNDNPALLKDFKKMIIESYNRKYISRGDFHKYTELLLHF